MIKVGDPAAPLVDLPEGEIQLLREQVGAFSAGALNQIFNLLYREEVLVRLAAQPRLAVEMVLIQICQIKPALPMDDLINSVEALRQGMLSDGGKMMTAATVAATDAPWNPAAYSGSNEDSPPDSSPSTLTLLMARIPFANDPNHSPATNHLAVLADRLNASSYLHGAHPGPLIIEL